MELLLPDCGVPAEAFWTFAVLFAGIGACLGAMAFMPGDDVLYLRLNCPRCAGRHVDEGEWLLRRHRTRPCEHRGCRWRPTAGIAALPRRRT